MFLMGLVASPLQAQEESEPDTTAQLPEAIRKLLLGVSEPGASGMGVLAVEGAVLPERPGLIRRTPYGEWAFIFVDDNGQPRAMGLLPCRQLERIVESVDAANPTETPAVRLTGLLTVYDRVNYLLPTNYAIITATPEPSAESDPDQAADPLSRIDPRLSEIAKELEAGRTRARSLQAPMMAPPSVRDSAEGQQSTQGEAVERGTLQEGDRLVRRRARLERQRGLWTLRFDQDPEAPSPVTPLTVLPNSALRAMENSVNRYGDQAAFEVSGTIYRYGRQPYVLITMHFLQPLDGLRPRG